MSGFSGASQVGEEETNEPASNPFTQYYGQLQHQGNMLQDLVRTGTYQQAFLQNKSNFEDKVVLDVGTGTGILAFFAAQAGARKVYAVDASDSVHVARQLAEQNGFSGIVEIIQGKIEEISLPSKVDVIVSEPIGFLLVHERMLESYIVARDRFLKPKGLMLPTTGSIVLAPLSDDVLFREQSAKSAFWNNNDFFGIDISSIALAANQENFSQAIVGNFSIDSLLSFSRTVHCIDFSTVTCEELQNFEIPFSFRIDKTGIMHGFGGWFDIMFLGSTSHLKLTTSPDSQGTHWYQCRLLLREPIAVNRGQCVTGKMLFKVNKKFSYDIHIAANLDGTNISSSNIVYLHDQAYNYLQQPQEPTY